MAKFVTIGYGDQAGYDRNDPAVRDMAHAHDEQLKANGAVMGIAGRPVQVRNPANQGVHTDRASFMRSELPLAGFALIDAKNIEEAIALVSKTPCAVNYGVVEVWPLQENS